MITLNKSHEDFLTNYGPPPTLTLVLAPFHRLCILKPNGEGPFYLPDFQIRGPD